MATHGGGRTATSAADEERTVSLVMRGLLHDLANVLTVLSGVSQALRVDDSVAAEQARLELERAIDGAIELHAQMCSILPDRSAEQALDPRDLGADVVRLLAWHAGRHCTVTLDEGPAAPILGEAWRLRRQLLAACDAAAGTADCFRFSFRVVGDVVSAVAADGATFWSAPTLAASRDRARTRLD